MVVKRKRKTSKLAKPKQTAPRRMNLDEGPRAWLLSVLESAYTRMEPKEQAQDRPAASLAAPEKIDKERAEREECTTGAYRSRLQPGRDETALAYLSRSGHWTERLGEYHRRKLGLVKPAPAAAVAAPMPAIPGANNWTTIGPAGVDHGYARGRPFTSGRAFGIAVAPGGQRIYVVSDRKPHFFGKPAA